MSFLRYRTQIPAAWPVINLASAPTACVRFDRHAVYLGTPGPAERCPAHLIAATTEALLVEPLSEPLVEPLTGSAASPAGSADPTAHQYQVADAGAGVKITATYGADRALIEAILAATSGRGGGHEPSPRRTWPAGRRPEPMHGTEPGPASVGVPPTAPFRGMPGPSPQIPVRVSLPAPADSPPPVPPTSAPSSPAPSSPALSLPAPSLPALPLPAPPLPAPPTSAPSWPAPASPTSPSPTSGPSVPSLAPTPLTSPAPSAPSAPTRPPVELPQVTLPPVPLPPATLPLPPATLPPVTLPPVTLPEALPPPVPAGTTNDIGPGFDACAAPSAATMSAWLSHSPYRAVGIYIGGADRACAQPNLTAAWVSQQAAQGWHFIPIYVGPQAEYRQITAAVSQGLSAADDAITQAQVLGLGPGTPLYYDMEAYPRRQRIPALTLLSAWTVELHRLGYRSGVYSSADSAVTDLADHYTSFAVPDVIYFARWNRVASTSEQDIHSGEWTHHQRIHQYSGSTRRSYGGYRLNIDRDYLDVTLPIGTGAAGGAPAPWPSASPADNQPPATPLPDPTPPLRIPANPSRAARHLCTPPATCHA